MKTAKIEIKYIPITEIKAYERNVKQHPQSQIDSIKYSIEKFGMCDPLAVDKDGVLIEGHGRLEALKQLGAVNAPVIELDNLDKDEAAIYRLAHNSIALSTGIEILDATEELSAIKVKDIDFDALELPSDFDFDMKLLEVTAPAKKEKEKKQIECPLCGGKFLK